MSKSAADHSSPIAAAAPVDGDWCLQIYAGLHRHACVNLRPRPWYLVGAAEDCDVVLRDEGLCAHHLLLSHDGQDWSLRALDAALTVNGTVLPAGQSTRVVNGAWCELGALCFGVAQMGSAAWREQVKRAAALPPTQSETPSLGTAQDDATLESSASAELNATNTSAAMPNDSVAPTLTAAGPAGANEPRPVLARSWFSAHWRPSRTTTFTAAGVVLALLTASFVSVVHSNVPTVQAAGTQVRKVVADLGLTEIRTLEDSNGHVHLEGTVATEALRTHLQEALKRAGLEPSLDVVTGERLALGVQDSFRQKGLTVRTRYAGAGKVSVAGVNVTAASEQVIRDILAKTPSVTKIEFESPTVPDATLLAQVAPPGVPGPGAAAAGGAAERVVSATPVAATHTAARDPKRVVAVVGGEQAYLLTQDGMRYLTGAVLPDGSLIESVEGHGVTFLRNGNRVQVSF